MDLIDFRGKITLETDWALDARSDAENADRSEIARKVLHEWAVRELHAASLLAKRMESKGNPVACLGLPGEERTSYHFEAGK